MNNPRRSRPVGRRFGALRRRPWTGALGGLAVAVIIAASVGLAIGDHGRGDFVQTRGSPPSTFGHSIPATSTTSIPSTSEPSTLEPSTAVAPSTTDTAAQPPPANAPTTEPSSPWQVSETSGLTNLAPVTITATGIPSDTYYIGQCPAGQAPSFDVCVQNDAVVVTNGTLTSTVHAFWWLNDVDCGSAPGTCVVGAMNASESAVVASFPISFDPARRPTITVTPNDPVTDGQTVVVRGFDVGAGTVQVGECLRSGRPACTFVKVTSRPNGTFSASMTVSRRIDWWGRGGPVSSTCGMDDDCVIEVWLWPEGFDSKGIWINPDRPVALQFAPEPPPSSTTSPHRERTTQ